MKIKLTLVFLLVFIAGCSFATPAPIQERPWWITAPDDFCVTSLGIIYVPSGTLDQYKSPISLNDKSLMMHEQLHALRQHQKGMFLFASLWATSASFRWQEETVAYELQINYLASQGVPTSSLRTYFLRCVINPFYREMIDYDTAAAWFDMHWPPRAGFVPTRTSIKDPFRAGK